MTAPLAPGSAGSRLIVFGFGAILILVVLNAVVAFRNARRLFENDAWVSHTHEVIGELNACVSDVAAAESAVHSFVLTGEETSLSPFGDAERRLTQRLSGLRELVADNPSAQQRVLDLRRLVSSKFAEMKQTIATRRDRGVEAARALLLAAQSRQAGDAVQQLVAAAEKDEKGLLARRAGEARTSYQLTLASCLGGALLCMAAVAMAWRITAQEMHGRRRAEAAAHQQREWCLTCLRSIGDAVIITDKHGYVRMMNPEAERLTGWHDDAIGHKLSEVFAIVNEETREPVESPVDKVLREGTVQGLANHTSLVARDGRETPVDDSAAPILNQQGEIDGVVLVFRDITARRRAELAHLHLAAIVESSEDAIISQTPDGTIRSWNRGAHRLFGYGPEEMVGKPITPLLPAERRDEEEEILHRLRQGERIEHLDTVRVRKDHTPLHVSISVSPIRSAEGEVIGSSKIIRDISERVRLVESLCEADRQKNAFLAMLAHELRNPLAPISNAVQIMRRGGLAGESHTWSVDVIERQLKLMTRMVDDLLDVSRIARGKVHLQKENVELAVVLERAVEMIRPLIDARQHTLTLSLPDQSLCLDADPSRLAQVFGNLLNNAAKYTEMGGSIAVSARVAGNEVVVCIGDNGVGIAHEMLPRIFEPFIQVEQSLPRAQGGLGIGLALVRHLVEMHHGTVVARSPGLGHGSEFEVRLPLHGMPA